MLRLHLSNRFEVLTQHLQANLELHGLTPFDSAQVVVPSAAVRRRLTLDLADAHGICAQVQFPFLAQWLWQRIAMVTDAPQDESPFAASSLVWRIERALDVRERWLDSHPRLAGWLGRADELMRFELATRLATQFDRYMTWRPDWLQAWSDGHAVPPDIVQRCRAPSLSLARCDDGLADARWQGELWRRLQQEIDPERRNPAEQFVQVLGELDETHRAAAGLPAVLHLFCLPDVAPVHRRLLVRMAQWMHVHVYLLNPCREYWFDLVDARRLAWMALRGRADVPYLDVGHRLLAGWGTQSRTQLGAWLDLALEAEGMPGTHDQAQARIEMIEDYVPNAPLENQQYALDWTRRSASRLARIQDSILDLDDQPALQAERDDRSLEIHVCHSRWRELEVLQDRILGWFADDATLRPHDVMVAVTDLEATAPLIHAVFGNAFGARFIPYAITGRARAAENPAARLLLDLLALFGSRFEVSAVLALLDDAGVQRRFGIDDDDIAAIGAWLRDAGFHWGLHARHRAEMHAARQVQREAGDGPVDAPGTPARVRYDDDTRAGSAEPGHTAQAATDRLLMQYVRPHGAGPFAGVLGAGAIEGQEGLRYARWMRFVHTLDRWRARCHHPAPLHDWPARLVELLDAFIEPDQAGVDALREVRADLAAWGGAMDVAPSTPESARGPSVEAGHDAAERLQSLAVVTVSLQQLFDVGASGAMPTGAITFGPVSGLRSLPYRHIAVIGLDDGVFPRTHRPSEFDLMGLVPRPTDLDPRTADRNQFLDLVLSARQSLHLSHVGRDARDNSTRNPSIVVDELLDWLERTGVPRAQCIVLHPLQPFSATVYGAGLDDERVRGRDATLAEAVARAEQGERAAVPVFAVVDDEAGQASADLPQPSMPVIRAIATVATVVTTRREVDLADLIRALRDPATHWLREALRIDLHDTDDDVFDVEPLSLDSSIDRALERRLLPRAWRGASREELWDLARAAPEVPVGPLGDRVVARQVDAVLAHIDTVRRYVDAHADAGYLADGQLARVGGDLAPVRAAMPFRPIDLTVDGVAWRIQGSLGELHPCGLLRHQLARLYARRQLDAWARHLVMRLRPVDGLPSQTLLVGRNEGYLWRQVDDPQEHLATLVRLYAAASTRPVPFFPDTSLVYADARIQDPRDGARRGRGRERAGEGTAPVPAGPAVDESEARAMDRAIATWAPDRSAAVTGSTAPADSQSPAVVLAWRGHENPLAAPFGDLAMAVFGPLLEHRQKADPGVAMRERQIDADPDRRSRDD